MASSKQNSPQKRVVIPGARESNAGDEFHVLWASHRALKLIEPNTDFKLLVMEEISPGDVLDFEGKEDYFLGADLTEYYGGRDFSEATKIIIAQLKYSTRHPDTAWTAARLCAIKNDTSPKSTRKNAKWKNSVIGRLTNLYLGFATKYPLVEIVSKLKIELVSNQPVASNLQKALLEAQELLAEDSALPIEQLSKELEKIVSMLKTDAKLTDEQIRGFLQVLNLDSCGVGSLEQQRIQLGGALATSIKAEHENALLSLCDRIRKEALPKNNAPNGLTDKDILACLGVASYDRLFPATTLLKLPEKLIRRSNAELLAGFVVDTTNGKILLHGEAGVGKTTTVQTFSEYLPVNSSSFIYDCYGAGSYLDVGNERYILQRFVTQITNEMAVKLKTPLLLRPANNIEDMWRDFQNNLELAAQVVASENGLLVIVVDAADNAIFAARHFRGEDRCFLPGLWSLQLPANCRLIISCRTHRRSELQPPKAVKVFELSGFDEVASGSFLRNYYPGAKAESISLFYEKTGGNPRVQDYTVNELLKSDQANLEHQLGAMTKKSLHQIFQTQFVEALEQSVDKLSIKLNLAILMCLPRPLTVIFFAAACGVVEESIIGLCKSLAPGIYQDNGQVYFRDEDFESFLREELKERQFDAYQAIAKYCLTCHSTDEYASSIIAEQLFQAQMLPDLINLVLDEAIPKIITDEVLRMELARNRIKRALEAATTLKQTVQVVQLLIIAAEINSSNYTIGQIMEERTELALRFGDVNKVRRQLLESDNQYKSYNNWFGGTHYKLAALFARLSEEQHAKDHLASGYAWLKHYAQKRKEKERWHIENRDICYAAEAIYRLNGLPETFRWLRGWRPSSSIVDISYDLMQNLARSFDRDLLETEIISLKLPHSIRVMAISAMWSTGQAFSVTFVSNTLDAVISRIQTKGTTSYKQFLKDRWIIDFCEVAIYHKLASTQILTVLESFAPKFPIYRMYDVSHFLNDYELPFKAICLTAKLKGSTLEFNNELIEKFNENITKGDHTPKYVLEDALGTLLSIYNQHAQMLIDANTLRINEIETDIKKWRGIRKHRWFNKDRKGEYFWTWAEKTVETILLSPKPLFNLLHSIADLAQEMGMAPFVWRRTANLLFRQKHYHALAYDLVERAAQLVAATPMSARERWEFLLDCSELVLPYDKNLAQDYYRRALESASGIDDEYARLITLQAQLALQLAQTEECQQPGHVADHLIRVIEEYEPYVSTQDRLAWEEVLASVTRLNVNKGLALSSRWDDERRYLIRDGIIPVVQQSVVSGTLLPLQGLAMLKLAGENANLTYSAKPILEYVKNKGNRNELRRFIEELGNQILLDTNQERKSQAISELVNWIDINKLDALGQFEQIRRVQRFLETLLTKPKSSYFAKSENSEINLEEWLEKAYLGDFSNLEADLIALKSDNNILEYLKVLGVSLSPSQREMYLEKLSSLDLNKWTTKILAKALLYQLERWSGIAGVKNWLPIGVNKFFEKNLSKLLLHSYETLEVLQMVRRLAALGNMSLAEAVVPTIVKNLETMGGQSLCDIVRGLCLTLEPTELEAVVAWSLSKSLARLPATERKVQIVNVPTNFNANLAGLIWSLLGHPDKTVRWQAIHMSRQLLKIQSEPLLSELIGLSRTESAGAFRSDGNNKIFYWLSARTYLMLLLSKLAKEHPEILVPYLEAIADHVVSPDLPHAQIRELAKDTVLSVLKKFPNVLPEKTISEVMMANTPRACLFPRGEKWDSRGKRTKNPSSRFDFDYDTVQYWYSGLMSVFGLEQDVTFHADKWISDKWGFTNEDWLKDPRELYDGYKGDDVRNDHGRIPKIEILRTYLEYHAMMCAAGELIDQAPVAVSTWSDEDDIWSSWLRRRTKFENDYWLSDLRSATPLRADCWGSFSSPKDWQNHQDNIIYLKELGLENTAYPNQIVIGGSLHMYNSEQRQYTAIKSALVTPETARALLYALQNAHHFFVYNLPTLPGEDCEIEETGFELYPIIESQRFEPPLEEHDPFLPRENLELNLLSQAFLQQLNLTQVPGTLNYQLPNDGKSVVRLELWQDGSEEEYIMYPRTNGHRLWVDLEVLFSYLRLVGKDLIFEVRIDRQKTKRNYKEEQEEYDNRTARLFLLRANGLLETVDEHRQIRPLNRS
jgi:hypothetical protein